MTQSGAPDSQELADQLSAALAQRYGQPASTEQPNVSGLRSQGSALALPSLQATGEAEEPSAYGVFFRNGTQRELDVAIAFKLSTSDEAQAIRHLIPPDQWDVFVLTEAGQCQTLQAYILALLENDQMVNRFPPEGVMTPELASELNPEDTEACIDIWGFSPRAPEPPQREG
jgi:hypothetical protein